MSDLLLSLLPLSDSSEPGDFRPPCPCCGGRMIVIEVFESTMFVASARIPARRRWPMSRRPDQR
ncbi:MAG: hypothetical protein EOS07_28090 [Mesorhizobium sp.]|nr:MAG: hypothetical protein EOS07_28090 [Mesorhizobium sp.]